MSVDVQRMRSEALRALVYLALEPGASAHIRWGPRRGLPSILNVAVLHESIIRAGADPVRLLMDDSPMTPLEKANGRWRPAMANLTNHDPMNETVASLAAVVRPRLARGRCFAFRDVRGASDVPAGSGRRTP